jgi:hypothetical protein
MKYKIYQFMRGRYGKDQLNSFLLYSSIFIILINILLSSKILVLSAYLLMLYNCFRLFSRNIYKRRKENNKFLSFTRPIRKRISVFKKNKASKNTKHFLCPKCLQILRVPKGKGTIVITCPTCLKQFNKKS